jgi:hypothetical protein
LRLGEPGTSVLSTHRCQGWINRQLPTLTPTAAARLSRRRSKPYEDLIQIRFASAAHKPSWSLAVSATQACRRRRAPKVPRTAALHSLAPHSITSSARARSVGGIVRPRAFAVLALMTSSNFVGWSTGMSAGFVPLRTLSTMEAALRFLSGKRSP